MSTSMSISSPIPPATHHTANSTPTTYPTTPTPRPHTYRHTPAYRLLVSRALTQQLHLPIAPPSPSPSRSLPNHQPNRGEDKDEHVDEKEEEGWVIRDRLVARERVRWGCRVGGVRWEEFVGDVRRLEGGRGVLGRGVYEGEGKGVGGGIER
ncbi:hypothetical protein P171DRAFT_440457 [Karstenula rhodostoma CBS 690.94]|uniref:Uncharacterized protein n=1 Tax=Karstenula rhodostoma CBS 690.94 TaxID=1392251 RepID=A0A9P4PTC1_9PLEO|nr:hypothetical protein P171DRAFT_440457 [Karstenula rhodostoma CBS 690.94]